MAIKVSDIAVLNVYNPPTNLVDNNVLHFVTKFRKVIICDDFNAHHKLWNAESPNINGHRLFDFIEQNDYSVMNTDQPTHMTLNAELNCSLIDLTLCSPTISHKCHVEVSGKFLSSDHCLIFLQVNSASDASPSEWTSRWSFTRADWISFYHLCNAEITMNLFSTNTQLFYYRLTSTISSFAERTIPRTKQYNKVSVSWWNKSCQIAINNKRHALNSLLKTRHPSDIKIFKRTRGKAKKILNAAKQSCWENYYSSIYSNAKLGQVWSTIRRFTGQQTSSHFASLQQHGITNSNNQQRANMLANRAGTRTEPTETETRHHSFKTETRHHSFETETRRDFKVTRHETRHETSCAKN